LAWELLQLGDPTRLSEAEEAARHAADLDPSDANVLHTLSDVLAARNKWTEALEHLSKALEIGGNSWLRRVSSDLIRSLIAAVIAGHAKSIKEMIEEFGAEVQIEPLWHAIRVELGEELEPLPAEIVDAMKVVQERIAKQRKARG
jgi:tetratricopeptide (TPR) repeat protein